MKLEVGKSDEPGLPSLPRGRRGENSRGFATFACQGIGSLNPKP